MSSVVDLSSTDAAEQYRAVEEILETLELQEKPRITVLNKIDLLVDDEKEWSEKSAVEFLSDSALPENENAVMISAGKRWGMADLFKKISQFLVEKSVTGYDG